MGNRIDPAIEIGPWRLSLTTLGRRIMDEPTSKTWRMVHWRFLLAHPAMAWDWLHPITTQGDLP